MNFHSPTFNLVLSEADRYAHAGTASLRHSGGTDGGENANLFHFPVTFGSLAELNSDSDEEIIEAIGKPFS